MKAITKVIKKEYESHKKIYWLLGAILALGLFVRVFRIPDLLAFYYDEGRDAKVIWDFWHKADLFLVGPTTGIHGILRGPWYYWLIAPFYLIGGGSPAVPSYFLSFLTIIGVFLLFYLAKEAMGYVAGLLAATIGAFSYFTVLASRWLSNPTPMLLISMLLIYFMYQITKGKKNSWLAIAFLLGLAMQFGSAAEVFYFPVVLIFAIWQRKYFPSIKQILLSIAIFIGVFVPQIVFDIINDGILSTAIKKFLFAEESFKVSFAQILQARLRLYYDVFFTKLWSGFSNILNLYLVLGIGLLAANFKKIFKSDISKITFILWLAPMFGMLFFQGNQGNVYGYYFTGYYFVFILFFSIVFSTLWESKVGKLVFASFLAFFLFYNGRLLYFYLRAGVDGPTHVTFGNQKQAVDWAYQDADGRPFDTDVYVPPVIPHAYDYLFIWYGPKKYGYAPSQASLDLLYTIYEVDPPHPERLEAWLDRQAGIGKVEYQESFGGITSQKRTRL